MVLQTRSQFGCRGVIILKKLCYIYDYAGETLMDPLKRIRNYKIEKLEYLIFRKENSYEK